MDKNIDSFGNLPHRIQADCLSIVSQHLPRMRIENSTTLDLPEIFRLYAIASAYQRSKNVVVWPTFEHSLVETEIAELRQFKLIVDEQVACVWAITWSDPEIWEERNVDAAMYIHRIATNPNFRGMNFVGIMVEWARDYARAHGKDFVRLDTLGNNVKLITHYTQAGFELLGKVYLKSTAGLPAHYQTEDCCLLFEIKL
jgi:ribosomal protein S18 acetylase RimI-like enzyme